MLRTQDEGAFDIRRYLPSIVAEPRQTSIAALVLLPGRSRPSYTRLLWNDGPAAPPRERVAKAFGRAYANATSARVGDLMHPAFPKGVPWTEFPVWTGPFHAFGSAGEGGRGIEPTGMAPWIDRFEGYAVLEDEGDLGGLRAALHRHDAGVLLSRLLPPPGDARPIRLLGATGKGREVDAASLVADAAAHAAFHYSHRLNFTAIASKALAAAIRDAPPPDGRLPEIRVDERSIVSMGHHAHMGDLPTELVADPYTVQMLHAIRRCGRADVSRLVEAPHLDGEAGDPDSSWQLDGTGGLWKLALGLDCVGRSDGQPVWTGTGKHAPVRLGSRRGIDMQMLQAGLVRVDREGGLSLAPRGARFLELLHPDCEDPDALCRWHAPDGLILGAHGDAPRDWLLRHFRKMKTAVNRIG